MRVEQNDKTAAYIASRVLKTEFSEPMVGLCVMGEDEFPYGVIILNDFTGSNIEVTGIGRGCWTVPVIRDIARYILRMGCRRATARTRVSNTAAIRALERIGFQREGIAREWFDGEDAILFGLLASEQRIVKT